MTDEADARLERLADILSTEIRAGTAETREWMAHQLAESRRETDTRIAEARRQTNARIARLEQESADRRAKDREDADARLQKFRQDTDERLATFRRESETRIAESRAWTEQQLAENRRHFQVIGEDLLSKIQLVAEGVVTVNEKLDRFRVEVHDQFSVVDGRLLRLEARVSVVADRLK